jgi:parallel beta-helix repeat protein
MKKGVLRKVMVLGMIILFIGITIAPSTGMIGKTNSSRAFLYVGGTGEGNYTKIQDAIDDATSGDTVFVYDDSSPYFENVLITKSLNLIGENNETTIIDGSRKNDTITINSQGVTISDFTIINSSYDINKNWSKAGIRVIGSNNIIKNNIIRDNLLGIFGKQVENLTIINNKFYKDGITFYPYDAQDNIRSKLSKKHFIHTIKNNTVNDKPLLYYVDLNDFEVPSNIGQLIAINCSNISVKNATFSNTDFMILMVFCSNCLIENSTFKNNDGELCLLDSDNNILKYNKMSYNFHGILLDYYSCSNKIFYNHISNNIYCGIMCEFFSNKNLIKYNNLIENNGSNAFFIKSFRNKWRSNYWDDWVGLEYKLLRFFPKSIFGRLFEKISILSFLNFDRNPAQEPYEI